MAFDKLSLSIQGFDALRVAASSTNDARTILTSKNATQQAQWSQFSQFLQPSANGPSSNGPGSNGNEPPVETPPTDQQGQQNKDLSTSVETSQSARLGKIYSTQEAETTTDSAIDDEVGRDEAELGAADRPLSPKPMKISQNGMDTAVPTTDLDEAPAQNIGETAISARDTVASAAQIAALAVTLAASNTIATNGAGAATADLMNEGAVSVASSFMAPKPLLTKPVSASALLASDSTVPDLGPDLGPNLGAVLGNDGLSLPLSETKLPVLPQALNLGDGAVTQARPDAALKSEIKTHSELRSDAVSATPLADPILNQAPRSDGKASASLAVAAPTLAGHVSAPQDTPQPVSGYMISQASAESLSQFGMQLQKRVSQGTTQFNIELYPADMGRVDVSLQIGKDGKIAAQLVFDSSLSAASFSASEKELRRHLADSGLDIADEGITITARAPDAVKSDAIKSDVASADKTLPSTSRGEAGRDGTMGGQDMAGRQERQQQEPSRGGAQQSAHDLFSRQNQTADDLSVQALIRAGYDISTSQLALNLIV